MQLSLGLKVVSCGVKLPVLVKKKLHSLRVKVVYIKDFLFITRNYSTWISHSGGSDLSKDSI